MASQFPEDNAALIERARRIILQPKDEWPRIEAEPMSVKGIMTGWAAPLAAIGPVAGLIGSLTFGFGFLGITYRPSIGVAIGTAIIGYVLALIGIWVIARIIDALAPTFGGTRDPVAAMKVAAYSATAGWLAGIFQIIPSLAFLGLLGLYSLYLLYLGLPRLMKAPDDKAMGYTVATIVAAVVVMVVIGGVTRAVASHLMRPALLSADAGGGTLSVPGVGSVDLGKMETATRRMQAAAEKASRPGALTPVATLQGFLPDSIGGWKRGDVETNSGSVGNVGGSKAEARYTQGDDSISLSVADVGAMGALAGLGQALNVQSNRESKTGYERTSSENGRMVNEKWDSSSRNGEYNVIVGNRFAVTAEGTAPDAATFKALVGAIDLGKLETLAKD